MQYPCAKEGKYELFQNVWDMIVNALVEGYGDYYCELHNALFNTEIYEEDERIATNILEYYGTLNAVAEIVEFEKEYFGEVSTDFLSPVKVLNMLVFVIGDIIVDELYAKISLLSGYWEDKATDDISRQIASRMDEIRKELFTEWFGGDAVRSFS